MLEIKTVIISKVFEGSQEAAKELINNGYNVYLINDQPTESFTFSKIDSDNIVCKQTLLESYFSCIVESGCSSEECIIVDNKHDNIQIAKKTGCKICFLPSNTDALDIASNTDALDIIRTIIYYQNENSGIVKRTMFRKGINIVIPMMGSGLRLHQQGTLLQQGTEKTCMEKTCMEKTCMGKPMISWVIQNLKIDATYIFIIRSDSDIDKLLLSLVPKCKIVRCEHKTGGQIESILLAEKYINNDDPLIVANDNQWLDWDIEKMLDIFLFQKLDSLLDLITFTSDGNHRYNYIKLDDDNNVVFIKQNCPITQLAMTDVYFWRRGKDFIRCAHRMTSFNKRIRGEFCTLLVVNELLDEIRDGVSVGKITSSECKSFITLQDQNDIMQFENYWISQVKNGLDV